MASKTISEAAKRACVVRVAAARKAGNNIVPGEAKRLNVSVQAIRNWCREAGVDLKGEIAPPSPPASVGSSPPPAAGPAPAAPAGAPSTAADDLADAEKIAGAAAAPAPVPSGPITPAEVQKAYVEASAEDKEFVVGTLEDFKKMAVGSLGPMFFKIKADDPDLAKVAGFGPMTRNVLRANAGIIAPDMRATIARGWDIVIAALAMDGMYTVAALMEIRKARAPKREEAEEREERPARKPAEEPASSPAADARPGAVWKPGDGVPPPPPPGSVVPR